MHDIEKIENILYSDKVKHFQIKIIKKLCGKKILINDDLFSDIRFISKIKKDFIEKSIEENYKEKLAKVK